MKPHNNVRIAAVTIVDLLFYVFLMLSILFVSIPLVDTEFSGIFAVLLIVAIFFIMKLALSGRSLIGRPLVGSIFDFLESPIKEEALEK